MKKHKPGKRQVVHEGRFLRFIKQDHWEFIERSNCRGIVIIVARTKDNKVIFTEQYRYPVKRNVIEFPAGLCDGEYKNEPLYKTAERELLEETGYKAKELKKLITGPVASGSSADLITMFLASGLTKVGKGGGVDYMEEIKVHEIPLKECEQWLKKQEKKGLLVEPKVYTGLYFLLKICVMFFLAFGNNLHTMGIV